MKTTLLVAAATALALLAADTASAGSRLAYFKVSLVASQDVTWSKHLTFNSCGGGQVQLEGNGTSAIRVRTPRPQPAIAQRMRNGRITLLFGHGKAAVPVVGTISRKGVSYATGGTTTGPACGRPEPPVASDCGTKRYPAGTTLGVEYFSPQDWPFHAGPTPLLDSIVLVGPAAPGWHGIVYQWCPGANGDDVLRGTLYENEGAHSSSGALPPAKLFGRLRRFRVTGHSREVVDTVKLVPSLNGTFPIRTTTNWELIFTRLARRPSGL